ncbi:MULTISPECIES: hypothetical protein [Sphingobacterium]|uniref:hypothetical protein n=1 Tax=Sphingobacterium TaxID=28453 RepID=UPI0013D904FD|nr:MULTISPECIES: hypothetical protein [unclassified Sphingobacterium]
MIKRLTLLFSILLSRQIAAVAQSDLPQWQDGNLDILIFKTGHGDAIFTIMPDGTTMLTDPGELDLSDARTWSPRNSAAYPNASKFADQWIADYIEQINPNTNKKQVDYAFITHFHDDHYGMIYPGARKSILGDYLLSGITGVGEQIQFKKLIDRGYPHYNVPFNLAQFLEKNNKKEYQTLMNYFTYLKSGQAKGMVVEGFKVGDDKQFRMQHAAQKYPGFKIQNISANGYYWERTSGKVHNAYAENSSYIPSENGVSCGILIEYNGFKFFHGGDTPGVPSIGAPSYYDMESKIAPSIGEVDVAIANHHAGRDVLNETFIRTLKPRIWFQVVWSADQPGPETLQRMLSTHLYQGPRDLFATDILPSNRVVLGDIVDRAYKSTDKHLWLQVKGDGSYLVHTLSTKADKLKLEQTFGPYQTKK